jgi:restriction endonuclease
MKFRFKVQAFQTEAVDAVVDCFRGQAFEGGPRYRIDPGVTPEGQAQRFEFDEGFRNNDLALSLSAVLKNIHLVQVRQNLTVSDALKNARNAEVCDVNLDIEMETGTGKTYCYIKTIFELNKQFGWSKYIVVVPSIAIREGVAQSLNDTADHFLEQYHKKIRFFIYNSKELHNLESFSSDASIHSAVQYDLIGKLASETTLTRATIGAILQQIKPSVFALYRVNPEDFLRVAARLVNEQKATVIVEHLTYCATDETYGIDLFTHQPKQDLSKGLRTDHHIYDYVFTDSETERTFVKLLDTGTDIEVYAKLPKSFSIPTPVGDYTPDWAIAFKQDTVKHIYFIAETKGSLSSMEMRAIEDSKIKCAQRFFAKITSDQVKYGVVDSYSKLMELVH